ncbi:hypothetical protein [Flavobacterium sp.]|uniref:hypothetical protein n=1 Tax=Flavobacterium sp. TaxID=239 RepID=UPI002638E3B5|nr:hypothetical protein [Flavobacterium sp.]
MSLEIKDLNSGQIFSIIGLEGKIVILKVDIKEQVVHFSYLKSNKILIYHIPISYKKFIISIEGILGIGKITNKQLLIIKEWEIDNGGVWDLTIKEVIEMTL